MFSLQAMHRASDAPGKRRTGRVIVQIARGARLAFPCLRSAIGKISRQSSPRDD